MKNLGRSVPRYGADRRLRGDVRTVADIALPRCLDMRLVRSATPFGRLVSVDCAEARALPGVAAVWSSAQLAASALPIRVLGSGALDPYRQPLLAGDMVRYAGEPVAAVFAETAAIAEDAAELVAVEVEADTPVLDPVAAASVLSGDLRATEATTIRKSFGDIHLAVHNADKVVERRFSVGRDAPSFLPQRASLACWCQAREVLTIWAGWRAVEETRVAVSDALGLPLSAVEIRAPDIDGRYGAGAELSAEDLLCAHAAFALRRPVRWLEDPAEQISAGPHARGIEAVARIAFCEDGQFLAMDVEFWCDQGAYVLPDGLIAPDLFAAMLPGPYALEAYRAVGHVRMTNKPPTSAVRGAGRVEAAFVRERLMDTIAHECSLSVDAVRRRNFVAADAVPADRHVDALKSRVSLDGLRLGELMDMAEKRFALDVVRRRAHDRRVRGLLSGLGTAVFVEPSGLGPVDRAHLSVDHKGNLEIITTAADWGQGTFVAFAQIAADIVGIEMERIRVRGGDTCRIAGRGATLLSGRTVVTGTAVQNAAEVLREKILAGAAVMMGVPAERLAIRAGRIREADKHFGKQIDVGEVARALTPGLPLSDGTGLYAEGTNEVGAMTYPYGVAVAAVEIDPHTAFVKVTRASVAYDAGNVINPQLAEDQLVSGLVQGASAALYSMLDGWDGSGSAPFTLRCAGAAERPATEVLLAEETPTPLNPLGIKGVGAGGIVGIGAAIAQAVDDALQTPGFVEHLPVSSAAIRAHLRERAQQKHAPVEEPRDAELMI
ncbi:MAG: xanthine dehydrogenase family protein [Pseudomonadota bacterium]